MNEARGRPRIAHIAIQVADIDRAASFYEEVFGFRRTVKFRVPGGGGITEIAPNGWHVRRTGNRGGEA